MSYALMEGQQMTNTKSIGRWVVSIEKDNRLDTVVKIYDSKFHSNRLQLVATYGLKTFICHSADELILDGSYSEWVMSFSELYQAQTFAYDNQFMNGNVDMSKHIGGGVI
jgi:hypothetical protein